MHYTCYEAVQQSLPNEISFSPCLVYLKKSYVDATYGLVKTIAVERVPISIMPRISTVGDQYSGQRKANFRNLTSTYYENSRAPDQAKEQERMLVPDIAMRFSGASCLNLRFLRPLPGITSYVFILF